MKSQFTNSNFEEKKKILISILFTQPEENQAKILIILILYSTMQIEPKENLIKLLIRELCLINTFA